MGMGALGFASMMGTMGTTASAAPVSSMGVRSPQFPAKAKRVIHLFMNGGPSHVDTFDPKPSLTQWHGKEIPIHFSTERKTGSAWKSPFEFRRYGQSGLEVSDLFKHTAQHADDLCVIRSMKADVPNHEP
jgi:hypothetical protein